MPRHVMMVALVALAGCAPAGDPVDPASDEIVGGTVDTKDPAVVAIVIKGTGFAVCTGTLIAPDVVLTAGHCPQERIWVRQGTNVRGLGWLSHFDVKATTRHPAYTGEGKPYDLALFQLERTVDKVAPVAISTTTLSAADVGASIRHVGFGTTGDDWNYVRQIATGGLKREVSYGITNVDDFFVYSGGPGKQTCIFDSGGPALRLIDGEERLIAVISAGKDCRSDGWDTRVDRPDVRSWIDGQLGAWGTTRR